MTQNMDRVLTYEKAAVLLSIKEMTMQKAPNRIGFSDRDVRFRVESYLNSKHFPSFRSLDVQVEQGIVTLTGSVENFHERQVALHTCMRVAGVLEMVDQVQVVNDALEMAVT